MASKYDVVVYGASGFTGSIVAQYLATHPQAPSFALAGRNPDRLRAVAQGLTGIEKNRLESIGFIEANSDNEDSLRAMAQQAGAVINMVGPYSLYNGFGVARAAAEAGAGYVDLTGESFVYHRMVKELDMLAKQTHAAIVPSSGFDSLPFDLTTYLAAEQVKLIGGSDTDHAVCGYLVKGSVSGGTIASAVAQSRFGEIGFTNAYYLSPVFGTQRAQVVMARPLPQFNAYGAFTLFTPHNTSIVNRTWGLLQQSNAPFRYGNTFKYYEGFVVSSWFAAYLVSWIMLVIGFLLTHVSFFGNFLMKRIPQGHGPSMERQLQGYGKIRTVAYGTDGTTKALAIFNVKGDPGYLKTAAFIAETALTIVLEKQRLSPLGQLGGVLTPASIGAEALSDRLRKFAGVQIQTADVSSVTDMSAVLPQVLP